RPPRYPRPTAPDLSPTRRSSDLTGWNLGATWQVTPATRIGATYRSKITHDLEGEVEFANRPAQLGAVVPNGDVEAKVKLPDTVSDRKSTRLNSSHVKISYAVFCL